MGNNEKNITVPERYRQLELQYPDEFPVSTVRIDAGDVEKHYVMPEYCQFPFFLPARAKHTEISRKYYNEKLKADVKNIEIVQKFEFLETDMMYVYEKNGVKWTINAHHKYGLPNDFDNHIWTYIQSLIAEYYRRNNSFALFYRTQYKDIFKYLRNKNIISKNSRGKDYYLKIQYSLERLAYTKYELNTGYVIVDKDNRVKNDEKENSSSENAAKADNENDKISLESEETENSTDKKEEEKVKYKKTKRNVKSAISLLMGIYFDSEKLPNGELAGEIAFSIDPLMLNNFSLQYFNILNNQIGQKLKVASSIFLFSRMTRELSLDMLNNKNNDFHILRAAKIKQYRNYSYNDLCNLLGIKKRNKCYLSRIKEDFKTVHSDLINAEIIEDVYFDEITNDLNKTYNFIYVLTEKFVDAVFNTYSKRNQEKYIQKNTTIEKDDIFKYKKKFKDFIKSDEIRKELCK